MADGWAPEEIVRDRDVAYNTLACLSLTNIGSPAGKPWIKPCIERVFRTIHNDLLSRFSGRAFSNVVQRGENNVKARTTVTLEAFWGWLVRWTVGAYRTQTHSALGISPAAAWEKATQECSPRSLTSEEMREAFGVRGKRKLGRHSIRLNNIDYQNGELMAQYLGSNVQTGETLWCHGDIGAIGISIDGSPWFTVTAADPMWFGKISTDRLVWLEQRKGSTVDPLARPLPLSFRRNSPVLR